MSDLTTERLAELNEARNRLRNQQGAEGKGVTTSHAWSDFADAIHAHDVADLLDMLAEKGAIITFQRQITKQRLDQASRAYAERDAALAEVADYRRTLDFGIDCISCAKTLEIMHGFEAEVERLRAYALDADVRLTETTIEHDDAVAEVAALRKRLGAVEALEDRWSDSTLHGKERGEPWVGWLVGLVRELRAALGQGDPR